MCAVATATVVVPFSSIESGLAKSLVINRYVRGLTYWLVELPLMMLYFYGPSCGGYGFWEGLSFPEICARLTSVTATHWTLNMPECAELIERKFTAFIVPCYIVIYFYILYIFIHLAVRLIQCRKA
jgi:hypothetical protein